MIKLLSSLDRLDIQLLVHLFTAHYEELLKTEGRKLEVDLLNSDQYSVFLHLLQADQGQQTQIELQNIPHLSSWEPRLIRHCL